MPRSSAANQTHIKCALFNGPRTRVKVFSESLWRSRPLSHDFHHKSQNPSRKPTRYRLLDSTDRSQPGQDHQATSNPFPAILPFDLLLTMDVDISDILASVSRLPRDPSSRQPHHTTSDNSVYTDHQLLIRHWTSERCSPSLLPYPTELMQRSMSRITAQIARIEDLTSSVPDSSSSGNGYGGGYSTTTTNGNLSNSKNLTLILSILQTDLSRSQYIIRSLLRQRLAKITKHAMFYMAALDTSEDKSTQTLLSESEIQFLRHHQSLLSNFYDASFLSSFPGKMRRLDDTSGGMGNVMVEGPDMAVAVVVRCLAEGWDNERDLSSGEGDVSVELRMRRGEVWVVRWGDVRGGVEGGELEVL